MYLGADSHDNFITVYDADSTTTKKDERKYDLYDLKDFYRKELDLHHELHELRSKRDKAIEQLKTEIGRYAGAYAKIEFDKHYCCTITTKHLSIKKLEKMKKVLNLEDIRCTQEKDKIVLELILKESQE